MKMKSIVCLALLAFVVLSNGEESEFEIVEAREICRGGICKKEDLKRKVCTVKGAKEGKLVGAWLCKRLMTDRARCLPGGIAAAIAIAVPHRDAICRGRKEEVEKMRKAEGDFEEVHTREICHPRNRRCKKEILKRRICNVVGGHEHCNRFEDKEHEVVKRFRCPPIGTLPDDGMDTRCKREFMKREK